MSVIMEPPSSRIVDYLRNSCEAVLDRNSDDVNRRVRPHRTKFKVMLHDIVTRRTKVEWSDDDLRKSDGHRVDVASGSARNVFISRDNDLDVILERPTKRTGSSRRTPNSSLPERRVLRTNRCTEGNLTTLFLQISKEQRPNPEVVILHVVIHIHREGLRRKVSTVVLEDDVRADD